MPELPEVETMRLSLLPYCYKTIINIEINNPNLRKKVNDNFIFDIKNHHINTIERIGKFLIFNLSNKKCLLIHAGMSGKFILHDSAIQLKDSIKKHNHIVFYLKPNHVIYFNDPRRFGLALTFDSKKQVLEYLNLGIDALNENLTLEYLTKLLSKSSCDIKTFLLNQKLISGIGNIYASEILFYSNIHPLSVAKNIPTNQIPLLIDNIKKVLNKAVKLGGSTLKDYKQLNGETGYFQNNFVVYQKENSTCNNCSATIKKITQKGRSTYFCPIEQVLY